MPPIVPINRRKLIGQKLEWRSVGSCLTLRSFIMNHPKSPKGFGSVSNKYDRSAKSGLKARISSTISTVINRITIDHQVNYNCFNEPFAV